MEQREIEILQLLMKQDTFLTALQIGELLQLSERTIKETVRALKSNLGTDSGARLVSVKGKGYMLKIIDDGQFHFFMNRESRKEVERKYFFPQETKDRVENLIRLFLMADEGLKSEYLAEQFSVSQVTLSGDMKKVREKLLDFHLDITSRPWYGSYISGEETDIRNCYTYYFYQYELIRSEVFASTDFGIFHRNNIDTIRSILNEIWDRYSFRLTGSGGLELIYHLMIMIYRCKSGHSLDYFEIMDRHLNEKRINQIVDDICSKLEDAYQTTIPVYEKHYLQVRLLANRFLSGADSENDSEMIIWRNMTEYFGINFFSDDLFVSSLRFHVHRMVIRLIYRMKLYGDSAMISDSPVTTGKLLASYLCTLIQQQTGLSVPAEENGILSIYAQIILNSLPPEKKSILIIQFRSPLISSQVAYELSRLYGRYIDRTDITEYHSLTQESVDQYDLVLATYPGELHRIKNVLSVGNKLGKEHLKIIKNKLTGLNKEIDFLKSSCSEDLFYSFNMVSKPGEVIEKMRVKLSAHCPCDSEPLLLYHNAGIMIVAYFGNHFAENRFAYMHSHRPFQIRNQKTETVIIAAVSLSDAKNILTFHHIICHFMNSTEACYLMKQNISYENMMKQLTNILENQ